jgi:two-component system phosphate regulon response regulator PhoB
MPKKVVIVEDREDVRGLHVALLRRWGCQVHEAADGRSGIAVIREQRPDLVLLDIMMPDLSGHDVLRLLRADPDPQLRATPVVMTTALASRELVAAIGALGVTGYLVKPFTRDRFDREIARVLGAPPAPAVPAPSAAAVPDIVLDRFEGVPVVVLPRPTSATAGALGDAMRDAVATLARDGHRRLILDLRALRSLTPGTPHLVAEALAVARQRGLRVAAVADVAIASALNAIAETRASYHASRDAAWAYFVRDATAAA